MINIVLAKVISGDSCNVTRVKPDKRGYDKLSKDRINFIYNHTTYEKKH